MENRTQAQAYERHKGVQRDDADDDILRPRQDQLEIIGRHGKTHAQHDDPQKPGNRPAVGLKRCRHKIGKDGTQNNPQRHILGHKFDELFETTHAFNLLTKK